MLPVSARHSPVDEYGLMHTAVPEPLQGIILSALSRALCPRPGSFLFGSTGYPEGQAMRVQWGCCLVGGAC